MEKKRIVWIFISLIVLITIAATLGTSDGQIRPSPKPMPTPESPFGDLSKYATVNFDAPEPVNITERDERRLKSQRYNNMDFVHKNPHPDDGAVTRHDEIPPPPIIPIYESNLVIVGYTVGQQAYLSNDKRGIYTEFTIRIEEVLKADAENKFTTDEIIEADREGGYVQYPNGQKILYRIAERDLPFEKRKYLLFLRRKNGSPNYEIYVSYELRDDTFVPLESGRRFDELKNLTSNGFLDLVRNKVSAAK